MHMAVVIGDEYFEVRCRDGDDDCIWEQQRAIELGFAENPIGE